MPPTQWDAYLAPVEAGTQALTPSSRTRADGTTERIAEGYEGVVTLQATVDGAPVTWPERRLIVRSLAQADAAERALRARLAKAQAALATLTTRRRGKPRLADAAAAQSAATTVLARYQVEGLVQGAGHRAGRDAPRPGLGQPPRHGPPGARGDAHGHGGRRGRGTGDRPAGLAGVCHHPAGPQLPLAQAVLAYRDEYLVERTLGRLKGAPVSLTPLYLARDDHATGLIWLLTIAVRVLTLLEFVVRRALAQEGGTLTGLYAGQPTRATARPTAERLLRAFQGLTLTALHTAQRQVRHLPPLTPLQRQILALLDHPPDLSTRLGAPSVELVTI